MNKTSHDRSPVFNQTNAEPDSPVFRNQPKGGRITGFVVDDADVPVPNADVTLIPSNTAPDTVVDLAKDLLIPTNSAE